MSATRVPHFSLRSVEDILVDQCKVEENATGNRCGTGGKSQGKEKNCGPILMLPDVRTALPETSNVPFEIMDYKLLSRFNPVQVSTVPHRTVTNIKAFLARGFWPPVGH